MVASLSLCHYVALVCEEAVVCVIDQVYEACGQCAAAVDTSLGVLTRLVHIPWRELSLDSPQLCCSSSVDKCSALTWGNSLRWKSFHTCHVLNSVKAEDFTLCLFTKRRSLTASALKGRVPHGTCMLRLTITRVCGGFGAFCTGRLISCLPASLGIIKAAISDWYEWIQDGWISEKNLHVWWGRHNTTFLFMIVA